MTQVTADISVSLDGFVAGPNDGPGNGLGDGGEALHEWLHDLASFHELHGRSGGHGGTDSDILGEVFERVGSGIVGRRMYDNANGWGESPPFDAHVFVLTHEKRDVEVRGKTTFTFVEGIENAVEQATAAAGGKDVAVSGGASVIRQCLAAGLLDEIQLHVVPLLLGAGVRLFDGVRADFEITRVIESPRVTHVRYRVRR